MQNMKLFPLLIQYSTPPIEMPKGTCQRFRPCCKQSFWRTTEAFVVAVNVIGNVQRRNINPRMSMVMLL